MRGGRLKNIDSTLKRLGCPTSTPQVICRAVGRLGRHRLLQQVPELLGPHAALQPLRLITFGEYAFWDSGDPGFMDRLFSWVASHGRTRMLIYNQGAMTNGPFRLTAIRLEPASSAACPPPRSSRRLRRSGP